MSGYGAAPPPANAMQIRGEQPHMLVLTRRSIVFSAAALFAVMAPLGASQETPSTTGASGQTPALQSTVTRDDDDEAEVVLAEPDFRVLNLPATLRLPPHASSFTLTHRFNGNLRQGSFSENASNLFGLDQGAVVGFEYRFGVVRHLQAVAYRTSIDKTVEFYGKFDAVRQRGAVPVSVSGLVSVEG